MKKAKLNFQMDVLTNNLHNQDFCFGHISSNSSPKIMEKCLVDGP